VRVVLDDNANDIARILIEVIVAGFVICSIAAYIVPSPAADLSSKRRWLGVR